VNLSLLIITDLEGTPGMRTWERFLQPDERVPIVHRHRRAVRLFCEGLHPVYRRIVVLEGHLNTLAPEALPWGVELVKDANLRSVSPWLNENWDLVLIGAHGMEGSTGPLAHSFSSRNPQRWFIDGVEVGEVGVLSAWAAGRGVPLVLVHGSADACREVRKLCSEVQCVDCRQDNCTEMTEEEERTAISHACRSIAGRTERQRGWVNGSRNMIERRFVGKSLKQRARAFGFVFGWWGVRLLQGKHAEKPDYQRNEAGEDLTGEIEAMLAGLAIYWKLRKQ